MTTLRHETGPAVSPIPEGFRQSLGELQAHLDGEPRGKLSGHVLELASTWVLGAPGFDLERFYREAKTLHDLTPEHDRVLSSYPDAAGYYMSLRLMLNEQDGLELDKARVALARAREAVLVRADWVEAEYPLIADGLRLLVAETAGGEPPTDVLWKALARRISDRNVHAWVLRAAW